MQSFNRYFIYRMNKNKRHEINAPPYCNDVVGVVR